jgi:hypothetical protein
MEFRMSPAVTRPSQLPDLKFGSSGLAANPGKNLADPDAKVGLVDTGE